MLDPISVYNASHGIITPLSINYNKVSVFPDVSSWLHNEQALPLLWIECSHRYTALSQDKQTLATQNDEENSARLWEKMYLYRMGEEDKGDQAACVALSLNKKHKDMLL